MFVKKFITMITGIFVLASFSGCSLFISDSCGLFGSTISYQSEFVIDKKFTPLEVQVGDTLILRPARHVHINYTYTGSPSCEGEDYKSGPDYVYPNVRADSLVSVKEFYDGPDPRWEHGSEMKVKIVGKTEGSTKLDLKIRWSVEGAMQTIELDSSLVVDLNVTHSQ